MRPRARVTGMAAARSSGGRFGQGKATQVCGRRTSPRLMPHRWVLEASLRRRRSGSGEDGL